ncbi:MAG: hypothetical protein ACOCQ4_03185 [bacterium]
MVVKKHIEQTLKELDVKYNNSLVSSNPNEATYYSKLALLEYCGWVEETLDDIARRSVKNKLKTNVFRQMMEDGVIGTTYGFQYKKHFRPMLCKSIGIVRLEKLETLLSSTGEKDIIENEFEAVKSTRNDAAHTWIEGVTKSYPAPSQTLGRLKKVYPVLKNIYSEIIKMNK